MLNRGSCGRGGDRTDIGGVCGFIGILRGRGGPPRIDPAAFNGLRDRLSHRGPDDADTWVGRVADGGAMLGHRRLIVIDPTAAGRQPMRTADGRGVLVYNGELYNDLELRRELRQRGVVFRTHCDTETLLYALREWGRGALTRLRGMFAFAYLDLETGRALLARDPLGVKPLYWWRGVIGGEPEFVFASEPAAIVAHPGIRAEPDMVAVSAYLTTIRTTIGERTLFEGVRVVEPGCCVEVDVAGGGVTPRVERWWRAPGAKRDMEETRAVIEASVRAHLRTDVPMCSLLSGGLDSSVIARVAMDELGSLRTYCSGARTEPGPAGGLDDFSAAREVAAALGSEHTEAVVDAAMFRERWRGMVARMGWPLSTPNEVAINEVVRTLRADGCIVTLSGEGADELFAGYDGPLRTAHAAVQRGERDGGLVHLAEAAWVPVELKGQVLRDEVMAAAGGDAELVGVYRNAYGRAVEEAGGDLFAAYLGLQREINLAGLLGRLDTAMMLEGVEGRTPFADGNVAGFAAGLPMDSKLAAGWLADGRQGAVVGQRPVGASGAGIPKTKWALRAAFAGRVPGVAVERAKASFPLPFQQWITPELAAGALAPLGGVVRPEILEAVAKQPGEHWRLAWPLCNLGMWWGRWW